MGQEGQTSRLAVACSTKLNRRISKKNCAAFMLLYILKPTTTLISLHHMQHLVQLNPYILITYSLLLLHFLFCTYLDCIGHPSIYLEGFLFTPEFCASEGSAAWCLYTLATRCHYIVFFLYLNSLKTVDYLLEVYIRLWIPSLVRISTSAWS